MLGRLLKANKHETPIAKINQANEAVRPLKTKLNSSINYVNPFDNPFNKHYNVCLS